MAGNERAGVAVVTGAAGGMGSATARQLARDGWRQLLLCDLDAGRLEAVAASLSAGTAAVDILAADIADSAFPDRLRQALGGRAIGALVHTAGISPKMAAPERILDVNLGATIRLLDGVGERMAPAAAIVLFASNSSYVPLPPAAVAAFTQPLPPEGVFALAGFAPTSELAYPLSKLGVRALARREAKAFGERGVRLLSISPGAVDTDMTRGEMAVGDFAQRMIERSALGRIGRADELAAVVAFLCSPAASFMAGCDVLVDGGQIAGLGF